MMRGGNREMRRMLDKMGLEMKDVQNVQEVIIKTDTKEIIITKPSVTEMKAALDQALEQAGVPAPKHTADASPGKSQSASQ